MASCRVTSWHCASLNGSMRESELPKLGLSYSPRQTSVKFCRVLVQAASQNTLSCSTFLAAAWSAASLAFALAWASQLCLSSSFRCCRWARACKSSPENICSDAGPQRGSSSPTLKVDRSCGLPVSKICPIQRFQRGSAPVEARKILDNLESVGTFGYK